MEETYKLYIFQGTVLLIHLAYISIFFGIVFINELYLNNLSILVQFVVCLFIIWKFLPLRKLENITQFDRSIIFYCATFLLLNVVSIEVYKVFIKPIYIIA